MARKAFLHINGVNYQLQHTAESEQDPVFQGVEARAVSLCNGSFHTESFDVKIDGRHDTRLVVASGSVWSAAVYLEAKSNRGLVGY